MSVGKRGRSVYDRQRLTTDPQVLGAECKRCPLYGQSTPVLGDGPKAPKLAVITDFPSREEANVGVPYIGRTGEFVENMLAKHGLTRHDVLLDYAVACAPPGGDMKSYLAQAKKAWKADPVNEDVPFPAPLDCCFPRLMLSLGVPRCTKCKGWRLSVKTHPRRCNCGKAARLVQVKDRPEVVSVWAPGNTALTALEGHGGIMKKQMYIFGE